MKRNYLLLGIIGLAMAGTALSEAKSNDWQMAAPYYRPVYLGNPAGGGPAHVTLANPQALTPATLPAAATNFLADYFPACTITECEKDFQGYSVDLADGIDLRFESTGLWTNVEAPAGAVLGAPIVDGLLPAPIVAELSANGVADDITNINYQGGTLYSISIAGAPSPYLFSADGTIDDNPAPQLALSE